MRARTCLGRERGGKCAAASQTRALATLERLGRARRRKRGCSRLFALAGRGAIRVRGNREMRRCSISRAIAAVTRGQDVDCVSVREQPSHAIADEAAGVVAGVARERRGEEADPHVGAPAPVASSTGPAPPHREAAPAPSTAHASQEPAHQQPGDRQRDPQRTQPRTPARAVDGTHRNVDDTRARRRRASRADRSGSRSAGTDPEPIATSARRDATV